MQKKYRIFFGRVLFLCLWLLLAGPIAHGALWALTHLWGALHEWFGSAFPLYSPISNAEGYRVFSQTLSLVSYALALFIATYFSVLLDNRKNERIISLTDGLYTVSEGERLYLRELYSSDLVASAVSPLPIYIAVWLLPSWFFEKDYSFPFSFARLLFERVSLIPACVITTLSLALFHIIASLIALDRWRARWLTDFCA